MFVNHATTFGKSCERVVVLWFSSHATTLSSQMNWKKVSDELDEDWHLRATIILEGKKINAQWPMRCGSASNFEIVHIAYQCMSSLSYVKASCDLDLDL